MLLNNRCLNDTYTVNALVRLLSGEPQAGHDFSQATTDHVKGAGLEESFKFWKEDQAFARGLVTSEDDAQRIAGNRFQKRIARSFMLEVAGVIGKASPLSPDRAERLAKNLMDCKNHQEVLNLTRPLRPAPLATLNQVTSQQVVGLRMGRGF